MKINKELKDRMAKLFYALEYAISKDRVKSISYDEDGVPFLRFVNYRNECIEIQPEDFNDGFVVVNKKIGSEDTMSLDDIVSLAESHKWVGVS